MKKVALLLGITMLLLTQSPQALGASPFPAKIFVPYVDVGLWPTPSITDSYEQTGHAYYGLAFITSAGNCTPSWGGLGLESDFYRDEVDGIRDNGGNVLVSFGGANGIELALDCPDVESLQAAYQAVIDRYDLTWIDLDIEGTAVADRASVDLRNKALQRLQAANPNLKVSYCLPVLPSGLDQNGLYLLDNAKENGVRIDVVDVMAMDYGDSPAPNPEGQMGKYAIDAGNSAWSQMQAHGIETTIGVAPMIGQNDVASERFYLADAEELLAWALENDWVSLIAMWSVSRDNGGCPGTLSPKCSGIEQDDFAFTSTFMSFSEGGNRSPDVSLTQPDDGTLYDEGADIFIAATAGDSDGYLVKVEFFSNDQSLGVDTTAPYEAALASAPAGTYELYAVATDDLDATRRSAKVQVFVGDVCTVPAWNTTATYWARDLVSHEGREWMAKWWTQGEEPGTTGQWGVWSDQGACSSNLPPTAAMTAPANGASFLEGSDLELSATAMDADGTVTSVEFFDGETSLGVDTAAPYTITWRNAPVGSHVLKAVATDDEGAKASTAVSISVNGGDAGCETSPWDPATVYWGNDHCSHKGYEWEAKWWTRGEEPGTTGMWGVWKKVNACSNDN